LVWFVWFRCSVLFFFLKLSIILVGTLVDVVVLLLFFLQWGEARLLIGAASINTDDWTDTRHVTRPKRTRTRKPEPKVYGATSLEIAD